MAVVGLSTSFVSLGHKQRPFSPVSTHPPPVPTLRTSAAGSPLLLLHCRKPSDHGKSKEDNNHQPRRGRPSFDVFLSFHGGDVRHAIVDHLYAALLRKGIRPFKDDTEMPRGRDVKEAISAAIRQSSLYVLLLSRGYASSSFCLDEAVEIKQRCCCRCGGGSVALPIFYLVSPDDVCLPTAGCFKEHFRGHARQYTYERVQGWIEALAWLGNISGFVHDNGSSEALLVENVSATIGKMVREMRSTAHFMNYSLPSSSLLQLASSRRVHYNDQQMELKHFEPQISATQGNDSIVRILKPTYTNTNGNHQEDSPVNHYSPQLCLVAQQYFIQAGASLGGTMKVDITTIATEAKSLWKDDKIEVVPLETTTIGTLNTNGSIVIIRFVNQNTRNRVLESSPWPIGGTLYFMRKLEEQLPAAPPWTSIPMWVRLYNVPEAYMNPTGLSYIASALGRPLYVDRATADYYCGSHSHQMIIPPYAKVCVEISPKDDEAIISFRPAVERTMVIAIGDDEKENNLVVVTAVYQLEGCG